MSGQLLTVDAERMLVAALRSSIRGEVIDREHSSYESARQVWNAVIDRHPAVIARCTGTADVVAAVRVAREQHPQVSIRGGGHQVAGGAVCNDGLVIDLIPMKAVQVNPTARTVRAQAGVTWGELDRNTQQFGLVTPGGEVSTTGIAGLTLGGGIGVAVRSLGLSCDNLRSIEIVTADSTVRTANRDEHQDLFWAARGGGRGLGVVTSFEYDLHPLGPRVAVAQILYPYPDAEQVLRAWREVTLDVPDTVTPELGLWSIPPDPTIPQDLHGSRVVIVAAVYAGPPEDAAAALAPLAALGTPLVDQSCTVSYIEAQSAFDPFFPPGGRYYMNSHYMNEITDTAISRLLDNDARRPTPEPLVLFRTLGGAVARIGEHDSAYPHRAARYNFSIDAIWSDPALDVAVTAWARSTWTAMRPYSNGGVYLNFAGTTEDAHRSRTAIHGPHQQRLQDIRSQYDPTGVFATAAGQP